jgi:hypothetical protein
MKYLLMMHTPPGSGDYQLYSWAPEDLQAHLDFLRQFNRELAEAGEYVDVLALTPPANARLVRAGANGAPDTDGPFAESKEFLAGFWVIEVDSPERAYELAAKASAAPGPGGAPLNMDIEVRQVMSGSPPPKRDRAANRPNRAPAARPGAAGAPAWRRAGGWQSGAASLHLHPVPDPSPRTCADGADRSLRSRLPVAVAAASAALPPSSWPAILSKAASPFVHPRRRSRGRGGDTEAMDGRGAISPRGLVFPRGGWTIRVSGPGGARRHGCRRAGRA